MTPARRFSHRLALALGESNPRAMLNHMPYQVYQDWIAYAQVEPFGEERGDLRAGIIASTVANCLARQEGDRAYKPSDFMPQFQQREKTPDELLEQVKVINWLLGGEVK